MILCPGIFCGVLNPPVYEVRFEFFDTVVPVAFKEVDFAAYRRGFSGREGTCANGLVHAAPGVVTLNG